jgi:hypothetical protein
MNQTSLGAARAAYWQVNGFGDDGGDSLEWVPLKLWKLTLKIPNSEGRKKAVRYHDLHHVLTGYATNWTGEAEIGAWELASGCLRWPAATLLNLSILAIGLVIAPVRLARAWARGRQTRNLYAESGVEHLLPQTVESMREGLGLDRAIPVRARDVIGMLLVALPALALLTALALAPLVGIAALVQGLS